MIRVIEEAILTNCLQDKVLDNFYQKVCVWK